VLDDAVQSGKPLGDAVGGLALLEEEEGRQADPDNDHDGRHPHKHQLDQSFLLRVILTLL
jgi:hypothetical protein